MKIEFSKNKEINEYISKAPKNQEIKINKDFSLQIRESYLETSYEYFDYGVESIDLICKRSNGNHATVNLSYWRQYEKNFGNGEFTHQVPENNTFIDEVISQILSKNKVFNISAELQKNINYQMERLEREEAKDEFVQKYMKLDPQNKGGFSEIYENGKKSYGIYFTDVSIEKYLTRAIDYLKTIESKEAHELIGEAQQYIEKYGVKEIQENTIDAKIENHLNKIVNSSNGNNQEIADLKDLQMEIQNKKSLGELNKVELSKLSSKELAEKMTQALDDIQFDVAKERQEYFKFISGFKSSGYTYRNSMLLLAQAKHQRLTPVFAAMKEWNKKGTSIKAGSHALLLCTPSKYNMYFEHDKNGALVKMPYTFDAKEIAQRDKLVKQGYLEKKEGISFKFLPTIFSIDQTNMQEQDKVKYLQQYNAYNTSEENIELLNKGLKMCDKLGIKVVMNENTGSALGFLRYNYDELHLRAEMPVDAKISVLTHELGHYFFHRHPEINPMLSHKRNEYQLEHKDREIQAQLFSHIALEGMGVDSESEYSLRYINGYLFADEEGHDMNLSSVQKSSLNAHLSIVHPQAITFVNMMKQEEITEMDVKKLKDFMPDRYLFDNSQQKAEVILNTTIIAQEKEALQKIEEAQKRQNDIKQQHKQKPRQMQM